jgi:MtrB/PioB family decaheme-associated outer membrane protein
MKKENGFRLLPIAASLLVAFGDASAQTSDEVKALITPDSSVSVGVGGVTTGDGSAKRFGVYTGMNKGEVYGLFDLNFVKRNDESGTWIIIQGRDLGLETRELNFTHQKQGDWKYSLEYNEIVRHDPYTIHTGMTGVGTTTPTINLINNPAMPTAWATANGLANGAGVPTTNTGLVGSDIDLKIKRTALGISAEKWLSPEWQVEGNFRTEERKGARLFGRVGITSGDMKVSPTAGTGVNSWAILLTPEPINSTTNIFEGKVSFNRDKLALSGGYFGSFFNNDFGSLSPTVPGTLNRGVLYNGAASSGGVNSQTIAQIASSAVALPPDNQAHQLYLSGVYTFSKDTRANFKVSYSHATQNESFAGQGLTAAAGAPANLGGEVNTILAMLGVSSRVTSDLTVKGNFRYEDRDDKTPLNIYNTNFKAGDNLNNTTNWQSASQTRTTAKIEGTYRLPAGYSAVLGADWENKKSPLPVANTGLFNKQVFFREEMNEYGLRGELRKALSETLNGSVSLEYKERRGSDGDWKTAAPAGTAGLPLVSADPAVLNNVFPDMYMDRNRTKARLSVDWTPVEQLDFQAIYEHAEDQYKRAAPAQILSGTPPALVATPIVAGARNISIDSFTLDGSYSITENWRVSAYFTDSEYRWNVNKVGMGEDTRNSSQTFGVAIKGKVGSKLDIGADFFTTRDETSFTNQIVTAGVVGNIVGWVGQTLPGNTLPKVTYNVDRVKLFANYALDKSSDIRFDALYQHYHTDDWQWGYNGVPFLYSDNTTVSQPMTQNFGFVAARYIYKF